MSIQSLSLVQGGEKCPPFPSASDLFSSVCTGCANFRQYVQDKLSLRVPVDHGHRLPNQRPRRVDVRRLYGGESADERAVRLEATETNGRQ